MTGPISSSKARSTRSIAACVRPYPQEFPSIANVNQESSQKKIVRLLARSSREGKTLSPKKYAKLELDIERCAKPRL